MFTSKLEYQDIKLKTKLIYSIRTLRMGEGKRYEEITHRDIIRGGSEVL